MILLKDSNAKNVLNEGAMSQLEAGRTAGGFAMNNNNKQELRLVLQTNTTTDDLTLEITSEEYFISAGKAGVIYGMRIVVDDSIPDNVIYCLPDDFSFNNYTDLDKSSNVFKITA
jgi:hypothetical protein